MTRSVPDDPRARFAVLDRASGHGRAGAARWHELRPDFAAWLDQQRAMVAAESMPAQTSLVEALQRLAAEKEILFRTVLACCGLGWSERRVAKEMRVSPGLVHRRKVEALGWLARSTGWPAEEIADLLRGWGAKSLGGVADR